MDNVKTVYQTSLMVKPSKFFLLPLFLFLNAAVDQWLDIKNRKEKGIQVLSDNWNVSIVYDVLVFFKR